MLCNGADESVGHLFFAYPISKGIWDGIREWLGMKKTMGSATTVLKAYRNVYRGNSRLAKMRCTALAACVYHVWNARNRALLENEAPNIEDIHKKIKIMRTWLH